MTNTKPRGLKKLANYNNGNNFRNNRGRSSQRGGRFFNNRGGGGGGFNNRDYRDRRYERRSRDRSEDRRSYSDEERKERGSPKRYEDKHLSDGEVEHDAASYVDDKEIEGKWADDKQPSKEEQQETVAEMNKLIDKIKKDKKDEQLMDRGKSSKKETW